MHARYVAHVALSQLDPVHIRYLRWTRAEALLDVQMLNVDELRQTTVDRIALYCSGAGDSLIRFQPYTTIVAVELARRLGTGKHPGELVSALRNGTERPQAFVREQAQAGVLFNLIDHALWGYRGQIGADWSLPIASVAEPGESEPPLPTLPKPSLPDLSLQPYPPTQVPAHGATTMPWKRPARIFFGAVFSSADEAALSQSSTDVHLHDEKKTQFGFILKHVGREEYITSELIPVSDSGTNLFRQSRCSVPAGQPPVSVPGWLRPACRVLHAPANRKPCAIEDWLAHYFVTPETLTVAMYLSERRPVVATGRHRTLYIATGDGALLRYVFNSSSKLFYDDSSQTTLQTLKDDLAAQKLLPSDFVHTVVDSGQLDVLRTSLCWDRPGLVKKTRSLTQICSDAPRAGFSQCRRCGGACPIAVAAEHRQALWRCHSETLRRPLRRYLAD